MKELPKEIISMTASREWRLHHYLWHQVRNVWWDLEPKKREEISGLGWEPPRKRYTPEGELNLEAGIDFFYMHRLMIEQVNQKLAELNDPSFKQLESWKEIPTPNDPDYPVPLGSGQAKSEAFYNTNIRTWEKRFTDSETLKTMTLSALGAEIESTIHDSLHMRWAVTPKERRPTIALTQNPNIDPKWDDPSYDYLGDFYSSHVNPLFWKIHGWVNDRVEDWANANPDKEIEWPTDWSLNDMPAPSSTKNESSENSSFAAAFIGQSIGKHKPHAHTLDNMHKVLAILAQSGHCLDSYHDLAQHQKHTLEEAKEEQALSTLSSTERRQFERNRARNNTLSTRAENYQIPSFNTRRSQQNNITNYSLLSWLNPMPYLTSCLPSLSYNSVSDENDEQSSAARLTQAPNSR